MLRKFLCLTEQSFLIKQRVTEVEDVELTLSTRPNISTQYLSVRKLILWN